MRLRRRKFKGLGEAIARASGSFPGYKVHPQIAVKSRIDPRELARQIRYAHVLASRDPAVLWATVDLGDGRQWRCPFSPAVLGRGTDGEAVAPVLRTLADIAEL